MKSHQISTPSLGIVGQIPLVLDKKSLV